MNRKIIHLDLDAFFCAVEELHNPALRGLAFAVGGRPEQRGVVASCSYPARKYGVRSAMPMMQALKLCPNLLVVPGRHKLYSQASKQVMERLFDLTPLVEPISIDEAFLDVTDHPQAAEIIARRLQETIRAELGLPCSLGVAANKLVAKIATEVGKAAARSEGPPNALQVVPHGVEAAFLAPLPAETLWGVGPKTAARLADLGIHTIGDIARWPETDLARRFGKHGQELAIRSRGIDDRPIVTTHVAKSISRETTFARDIRDREVLKTTLLELSESVSHRLAREAAVGTTVKLKLRWADFTTITRQTTLQQPTSQAGVIAGAAVNLFEAAWQPGRPVRLLGVGVSGLGSPIHQLSLWDDRPDPNRVERERRLLAAVEDLKERFGNEVLNWGKRPRLL